MPSYSLSFFAKHYSPTWWDDLTKEMAAHAADRARLAGCEPYPDSRLIQDQHIAWRGPPMGEVLEKLRRAKNSSA